MPRHVVLFRAFGACLLLSLAGVPAGGPVYGQALPADRPTAGQPAPDAESPGAEAMTGLGFLWTRQNEAPAGRLSSERDFVDLVLGGGKFDVFAKVKPPVRVVCLALTLEKTPALPFPGVRETIELLRAASIPPGRVVIGYNPERRPDLPGDELDRLVESVRRARALARDYGAPLLVGPGLREMQQQEHLYPELARHCDIWLIQSQRLQLDLVNRRPVSVADYRAGVERIVVALRRGNPDIRIFVQLVTTAEKGTVQLSAEQVAGYARALAGLADAVRIYGGSGELLDQVITILRGPDAPPPAGE